MISASALSVRKTLLLVVLIKGRTLWLASKARPCVLHMIVKLFYDFKLMPTILIYDVE